MSKLIEHVLLSIRILCSRTLRSSSCTHYFLAYTIFSIIYISLACPTQFLRAFYIDWATGEVGCKIYFYIIFLPPFLARIMLVLASFDRYCSSSKPRRLRSRSTIRIARLTIVIATILTSIYMSPTLAAYYWNKTIRNVPVIF